MPEPVPFFRNSKFIFLKNCFHQIDKLKGQLHELNEKAQLQYDLIGSLNRQIALEKKLRYGNQNFTKQFRVIEMFLHSVHTVKK